jgi:hypothetical protein
MSISWPVASRQERAGIFERLGSPIRLLEGDVGMFRERVANQRPLPRLAGADQRDHRHPSGFGLQRLCEEPWEHAWSEAGLPGVVKSKIRF